MRKKVISVILAMTMVVGSVQVVSATTLSEAEDGLDSANSEISSLEDELSDVQAEIDEADSELVETVASIAVINDDIENIEEELVQTEEDLAEAEAQEEEQQEAMALRIKYQYENGDATILTALLESDSVAEVLNKVDYQNEIYDYDRDLLDEYEATCEEVANLEAQQEEEKAELEDRKVSLEEKEESLNEIIESSEADKEDIEAELADAEALAADYEDLIAELNAAYREEASSSSSSSSSGSGSAVVSYASQFVGNPYVYGGTSLTNGCDCSGFVMSVYAHFGVSLPHSSSAMRSVGYGVSVSEMQAGDIVCYEGHVGIYTGNGTIVNALNSNSGIVYTNVYYSNIICVRRIF